MVPGPLGHELPGIFRRARKWKVPHVDGCGDEVATTAFY
jgi:hypothetical protein